MKGLIYEIICNLTNERYIGSTTKLNVRKSQHKSSYNNCSSVRIIERGDYTFRVLEEIEVEKKEDLLIRERHYVELGDCINPRLPYLTEEERKQQAKDYNFSYYHTHKEEMKEVKAQKDKEYYEQNKIRLLRVVNCECGSEYVYCGKSRHLKTKKHLEFCQAK
jgi:predicted GIY-YIG superfamily endonuclease